jgi:neuronal cell adhesion molecule
MPMAADAGQYQCFAKNKHGIASSNTVTMVNAFFVKVEETKMEIAEAHLGKPFGLKCDVPDAYPELEVTWTKEKSNGKAKVLRDPRFTIDPKGTLWFTNITQADELLGDNFYACLITSKYLNRFTTGKKVQMKVLPRILKGNGHPTVRQYVSNDQSVVKGEKVEIFCIYGGTPMPNIAWSFNAGPINFTERIERKNEGRSLLIKNATESDRGTYKCKVWHGFGSNHSHNFHLDVQVPPFFSKDIESMTVSEGFDVTFECEAGGLPEPSYRWYFNSKPISLAPRNSLRTVTRKNIIIRRVSEADMGNYGCNASTSWGYVYKDFYLKVIPIFSKITEVQESVETTESETTEEVQGTTETTETGEDSTTFEAEKSEVE